MTIHLVVIGPKVKSWAIGLEIACNLAQTGREVLILDFSDFEKHWPFSLHRRMMQFKLTSRYKIRVQKVQRRKAPDSFFSFADISSIDELARLKFQGLDIGNIILASLYAKFGSSSLDFSQIKISEVRHTIALVVDTLFSIMQLQFLKHFPFQEVVVFNGREPIEACCLLLAKNLNIPTRISERASTSDRYCIYAQSPHTNSEWWDKIGEFNRSVKSGAIVLSEQKRETYKINKSSGFDPYQKIKWREFMDQSERIDLPSSRYVVFYSVSTGEKSPFPEFDTRLGFSDQFIALEALIEIADQLNLTVVIRRHPNSLGTDGVDRELNQWDKFQNLPGVVYIGPTERIDSYVLATGAYACFTWRSTIGFDTLCLGIPTYSLGPSKWAFAQSQRAWDKEQLAQALEAPTFPNLELLNLYADYMSHFGEKLTFFREIERWGYISNSGVRVSNFLFQRSLNTLGLWSPRN